MTAAFPRACLVLLLAAIPAASRPAPVTLDAISANFWNNLADPACGKAPPRWRVHYGDVPKRLRKSEPWPEGIEVVEARSLREALKAALLEEETEKPTKPKASGKSES